MAKELKQIGPWHGNPPGDADEAQRRLAEVAIECFAAKGMRKAFMSEVARAAGITRPTLYSYYSSKENLMFGALGLEVVVWVQGLRRRQMRFDTPQERIVEGVLYAIKEIPKTRVLKFIAEPDYVHFVAKDDPELSRTLQANVEALEAVFELAPELRIRQYEIAEIVQRTITSFLQYKIGKPRRIKDLRSFFHRTLVPAVGLKCLNLAK